MKNAFYFTLKALFVLKIFIQIFVLTFFGQLVKPLYEKNKINLRIYDIIYWKANNYNKHTAQKASSQ